MIEYGVAPIDHVGRMTKAEVIRMDGLDAANRWVREWEEEGNGKVWRIVSREVVKTEWSNV